MSGSPLYIDGRLAGALSYQLQRFETVPHAGFTPIEDLMEVSRIPRPPRRVSRPDPAQGDARRQRDPSAQQPVSTAGLDLPFQPLTPVFTLSGIDPEVGALFATQFRELGLTVASAGGSYGFQADADAQGNSAAGDRFPARCARATPSRSRSQRATSRSPAPERSRASTAITCSPSDTP